MAESNLRLFRAVAIAGGLLLIVIGVRFLVVPEDAARTFGLAPDLGGHELHWMIGLRDIWLGVLAVVFAWLKDWRALAIWFATAAVVCFADAAIAATSSGSAAAIAIHGVAGAISILLARAFWRLGGRQPE